MSFIDDAQKAADEAVKNLSDAPEPVLHEEHTLPVETISSDKLTQADSVDIEKPIQDMAQEGIEIISEDPTC